MTDDHLGDPSPASDGGRIRKAAQLVFDTFTRDEAQGYRSRDRQFAIEILGKALEKESAQEAAPGAILSDQPTVLATQWDEIDL